MRPARPRRWQRPSRHSSSPDEEVHIAKTSHPQVLVIDDDPAVAELVQDALVEAGVEVAGAHSAAEGLQAFDRSPPDLVVLDLVMPAGDGWAVCRQLRQVSGVPILVLTGRGDPGDAVRALDLGADDYVTKPFDLEEMRARIQALLRRAAPAGLAHAPQVFQAGDVTIDTLACCATVRGRSLRLGPKEFSLLAHLVRNAGRTVSHQELLRHVWGPEYVADIQYLSPHIWRLRNLIEENPRRPRRILTWRGVGYRFVPVAWQNADST